MSFPKIKAALGASYPTILRALRTMGVPSRSKSDGVSLASRGDLHSSNGYIRKTIGKYQRVLHHRFIMSEHLGRPLSNRKTGRHHPSPKPDLWSTRTIRIMMRKNGIFCKAVKSYLFSPAIVLIHAVQTGFFVDNQIRPGFTIADAAGKTFAG